MNHQPSCRLVSLPGVLVLPANQEVLLRDNVMPVPQFLLQYLALMGGRLDRVVGKAADSASSKLTSLIFIIILNDNQQHS
jgi:hypothetical protein